MALVKCPKCQGQISSRATVCSHCGIIVEEYLKEQAMLSFIEEERRKHIIICPECQGEADIDDVACPHCGFPIGDKEAVAQAEEEYRIQTERALQKAKTKREREQREKIAELSVPTNCWSYLIYLFLGGLLLGVVCFGLMKNKLPITAIIILFGSALILLWEACMYFQDEKKRKNLLEKVITDYDSYAAEEERKKKAAEDERLKHEAYLKKIEEEQEVKKGEEWEYSHPVCPNCKSRNTQRISTLSRVIDVELLGIASDSFGKQYRCNRCKHLW